MTELDINGWCDEKLARGLAKQMMRDIRKKVHEIRKPKAGKRLKHRVEFARFARDLFRARSGYVGMEHSEDFNRFCVGIVEPYEINKNWHAWCLFNMIVCLDRESADEPISETWDGIIDPHAMARIIERTGLRRLEDILKFLRSPGLGWMQYLAEGCRPHAAFLPIGDSLLAVQGTMTAEGVLKPRITTYIDRRDMSDFHRSVRERLNPMTIWSPSFPSLYENSPVLAEAVKEAWRCGRDWEARREAAIARQNGVSPGI